MLRAGDYSIALETTLPLENYANETVTKFTGLFELEDGNTKDTLYYGQSAIRLSFGNTIRVNRCRNR